MSKTTSHLRYLVFKHSLPQYPLLHPLDYQITYNGGSLMIVGTKLSKTSTLPLRLYHTSNWVKQESTTAVEHQSLQEKQPQRTKR